MQIQQKRLTISRGGNQGVCAAICGHAKLCPRAGQTTEETKKGEETHRITFEYQLSSVEVMRTGETLATCLSKSIKLLKDWARKT